MRESRTYGSGRGACDETHVPTATTARILHAARQCGGCMAAQGAGAERPLRSDHWVPRHSDAAAWTNWANAFVQRLRELG